MWPAAAAQCCPSSAASSFFLKGQKAMVWEDQFERKRQVCGGGLVSPLNQLRVFKGVQSRQYKASVRRRMDQFLRLKGSSELIRKRSNKFAIYASQQVQEASGDGVSVESPNDENKDDFVKKLLREKPSQVEPRYLIDGRLYTLQERQLLNVPLLKRIVLALDTRRKASRSQEMSNVEEKGTDAFGMPESTVQRDTTSPLEEEKTQPSRRPVYLPDLLREYKGNLYVPEEAFKDRLPEVHEFNRSLAVLPEMSFQDFVKAVNANQVELLTSRGVSSPRGGYSYSDFIVDLKSIPGEQVLHTQKWAMHLNQDQSKAVLNLYKGPQREPYVMPPPSAPHPVAASISGRIMLELTVVASLVTAAAFALGGLASIVVFTVTSFVTVLVLHVLWPLFSPLISQIGKLIQGFWNMSVSLLIGTRGGKKGLLGVIYELYQLVTAGDLLTSTRTIGAIVFVLVAMAALAKFTLTRRPKDFTKWDLWQAIEFGQSKPQARVEGSTGIGFADVAGIDEVVEELQELVCYLKDPERFNRMGTKPPHGVLLEGPPGCGKTLLAKAIAGEAGVPFYQMAGSEFVEVLVGVGAARIRDLFKRAKVNRPAVVFIDEIDALGAMRHTASARENVENYNAGAQERETTLNQLLIELDGFDTGKGVIFLGATNRMDMLDPALLRPGRFDRKIAVRPPRAKGRYEILQVHSKNVKLSPSVDLWIYAKNLPGWTGAQLAQLLQDAALMAVRHGHNVITRQDLDTALDRLTVGPERMGFGRRQLVHHRMATNEIGMAMTAHLLRRLESAQTELCDRVSIVPRGETFSRTIFDQLDDESYIFERRPTLIQRMKVMLAGRAAEELVYGRDTSTLSLQYLPDASWLARKIVSIWNLDGTIAIHGDTNPWERDPTFTGPPLGFEGGLYDNYGLVQNSLNYNADNDIAVQTHALLENTYQQTLSMLQTYHAALKKAIYVVMDREEILGYELDLILDYYPAGTPVDLVEKEENPALLPASSSSLQILTSNHSREELVQVSEVEIARHES
ncbi:hypothetical protein O6H91_04G045700 [Diphasiastrum complanatum]|uniref:Uncharacterized protein n=1 Tax=Diphasiastrum complanatum TaxID=34168 RepID=A0ACC2DWF1_DIPCM|nr:hypothetical protein O6H91_04G045700 [Diphasiastrum complanatum]